ncbi:MAG: WD40 repeat domain-containing protein, partial [Pseudonocardia sp.]
VFAVAWSPGGARLATAGYDASVRLWDPVAGEHLSTLPGHTGGVNAVAWSPDGTRLATTGNDRSVRLWDPATGEHLSTLPGHTGAVFAVAWSPDGTRLATAGGDDQTVRLWDPAVDLTWWRRLRHRRLFTLTGHTGWVRAVAWSPDGTRLATTGDDRTVRLWDSATGEHLSTLTGHTAGVSAVAWSPDGTRLATVGNDGVVIVRDPVLEGCHVQLRLDPLADISWTTTGIAVAGTNGVIVLDLR